MLVPDDFMLVPDENTPERPVSEYQVAARTGCSRRTFLLGGGALVALAGGGWWLYSRFSQPAAEVPVDAHRIFNFPLTGDSPDLEYAWLPDNRHIACVTQSEIFLVDVKSGQMTWKQKLSSSNVLLIHWSTDGTRVLAVEENEIAVQDLLSGEKQVVWPGSYQLSQFFTDPDELKITFSPDETLLAVINSTANAANPASNVAVEIWNIQEGRRVAEYQIPQGYAFAQEFVMAWAPNGASLVVCTGWSPGTAYPPLPLPTLTTWRILDDHLLWTSYAPTTKVYSGDRFEQIRWSPDSTTLAYTYTTSATTPVTRLTVLDAQTGTIHFQTPLASYPLIQPRTNEIFVWSPDSTRLALLVAENESLVIQIWDAKTGQHLFTCQSVREQPGNIFWSPDSKYLVATEADQNTIGAFPSNAATLQFWDAQSGKALFSYAAPEFPESLLWSPDSRLLAVYTTTRSNCHQIAWGHSTCTATSALQVFQVR